MTTQDTNTLPTQNYQSVVNFYNEGDILEEVIVGRIEKSLHPCATLDIRRAVTNNKIVYQTYTNRKNLLE